MAKASKKARIEEAGRAPDPKADPTRRSAMSKLEPSQSFLAAAALSFEAGDEPATRAFAREVLAGRAGAAEARTAETLAPLFSTPEHQVGATPTDVARELILRTSPPLKAYGFVVLALGVFGLLLTLALTRT